MTAPAWGTAPAPQTETTYTVVGFYGYDGTRMCEDVTLLGPASPEGARAAEDRIKATLGAQRAPDGSPCDLQVCGVLVVRDGVTVAMDSYATYLDPDAV